MSVNPASGAGGAAPPTTAPSGVDEHEGPSDLGTADSVLDIMVLAGSMAGICSELSMKGGLASQGEMKLRIDNVVEQLKADRAKAAALRKEIADLKASAEADDPSVGDKILRFLGCQKDAGARDSANANIKSGELQQVQASLDALKSTLEHAGGRTLRLGDDLKQNLDDILSYLDDTLKVIDEHLESFERLNS